MGGGQRPLYPLGTGQPKSQSGHKQVNILKNQAYFAFLDIGKFLFKENKRLL